MTNILNQFIEHLNNEHYFKAHESIEAIWFPKRFDNNDETKLLKGFINAAVSFELHKRNKIESSKKVWKNYLKYKPLLYKLETPYINKYHSVSRYIEKINYKLTHQ